MFQKKRLFILILALIGAVALTVLISAQSPTVATAQTGGCASCHADEAGRMFSGKHLSLPLGCETCHEGSAGMRGRQPTRRCIRAYTSTRKSAWDVT
ncbi:MAG: hypothetical protein HND47_09540 [Chloroflexi bacterium]|nr:hypothetical protein [Chloroflexota bacterium]